MAFFCTKSGVRIVAPGISISAGGTVPIFDFTPEAYAAEDAAARILKGDPTKPPAGSPSADLMLKAQQGARDAKPPPPADPEAPPPEGSLARLWYDRAHAVRNELMHVEGSRSALENELDAARAQLAADGQTISAPAWPGEAPAASSTAAPETPAPGPAAPPPPKATAPAERQAKAKS